MAGKLIQGCIFQAKPVLGLNLYPAIPNAYSITGMQGKSASSGDGSIHMRINIKTKFGTYAAFVTDTGVYRLFLPTNLNQADEFERSVDKNKSTPNADAIAKQLVNEITLYHEGKLKDFNTPICPDVFKVSPFRKSVWETLQKIPYAETWSYGELAKVAGSTSGRATGGACSNNPVPLLIPCHRVIASNGAIGGFIGGKELKQMLLDLEKTSLS